MQTLVRVAELATGGRESELVTLALGSCVAIVLHDQVAAVGGLAHVLLPEPPTSAAGERQPAKFASAAVPALMEILEREGAKRERLTARLIGGASMFGELLRAEGLATGRRNVEAAREALRTAGVPVVGEAVGADHGRSVYFEPATGRVRVTMPEREEIVL